MMKKWMMFLLALLMLAAGAWAEEETPLPQSVRKLSEEIHPGYAIAVHDGWESERAGQFALVLKRGEDNILCIAEKAQERKTGARGLRAIIEPVMTELMYELDGDVKEYKITKAMLEKKTTKKK